MDGSAPGAQWWHLGSLGVIDVKQARIGPFTAVVIAKAKFELLIIRKYRITE